IGTKYAAGSRVSHSGIRAEYTSGRTSNRYGTELCIAACRHVEFKLRLYYRASGAYHTYERRQKTRNHRRKATGLHSNSCGGFCLNRYMAKVVVDKKQLFLDGVRVVDLHNH